MIETIIAVLTGGAGGGIVGGILALFKQKGETRERIAMAELELRRDEIEAEERQKDREHERLILRSEGDIKLATIQTESEAEIEVTNMRALGDAQAVFSNLNTSTWMDNLRASVRPLLAYYAIALFSCILCYFSHNFIDTITVEQGTLILLKLITTLTFMMSSIVSFYYVSRRNPKP